MAELSTGEVTPLVQGADFYSSPRIDPSGGKLAWVQWALPHMPWDDTQLCVAELAADGAVGKPRIVAGGADTSVQQPVWGPKGELWFVWDKSGWWNLYRESAPGKVRTLSWLSKIYPQLPSHPAPAPLAGLVDCKQCSAAQCTWCVLTNM
jgi:hypothetical protein